MTSTAEEQLRTQVRDTIAACGLKQIWIADKLGISQKHLSQLLTGRASLTLDWAEKILTLCRGARMLLFVTVPPGPADRPDRIRLDDLTSNNLDDLYDDLDRYAEVVREMNERLVHLEQRADRAEDALTRVREAAAWTRRNYPGLHSVNDRFAAALDQPALEATEATEHEKTTRVFAALHRSAEQDVSRVIALYERWVKAGPPPLGTSMSRWWDRCLVELHDAILEKASE